MNTTPTTADLNRTATIINQAQWGVAVVVMTGSAIAGGFAFHDLAGNKWVIINGVITALAVDWALAQWLRLSRILRTVGIHSPWGRTLECVTAGMTIYLNLGAAVFPLLTPGGTLALWLLGVAHVFVPVLLILVFLASGQANDLLLGIQRAREANEAAERTAQQAADKALREADQRRLDTTRREELAHEEQARRDAIRVKELTAQTNQLALTSEREAREHEDRHLAGAIAATMILKDSRPAPTRPGPVPTGSPTRPQTSPSPTPRVPTVPMPRGDTLVRARKWRASRTAKGLTAGRDELRRYLGVSEREARDLIRQLNAERPLRSVSGGAR